MYGHVQSPRRRSSRPDNLEPLLFRFPLLPSRQSLGRSGLRAIICRLIRPHDNLGPPVIVIRLTDGIIHIRRPVRRKIVLVLFDQLHTRTARLATGVAHVGGRRHRADRARAVGWGVRGSVASRSAVELAGVVGDARFVFGGAGSGKRGMCYVRGDGLI